MIVRHAAAFLTTSQASADWAPGEIAEALARRGVDGERTTVTGYVLSALHGAMRGLQIDLEAELDLSPCPTLAADSGERTLRVKFHHSPHHTFSAMHLGRVRRRLHRLDPLLLPTLLRRAARAGQHALPCFTPVEALAFHAHSATFGCETDQAFAGAITDLGAWNAPAHLSETGALARRGGVRTPSQVHRKVPYFERAPNPALLERTGYPADVAQLTCALHALEALADRLPIPTDDDLDAAAAPYPLHRQSLLLDPFPDPLRGLSFTREMHQELNLLDLEEEYLPLRTFVLRDETDLAWLDAYLCAVPGVQRELRAWLEALYRLGEGQASAGRAARPTRPGHRVSPAPGTA